MYPLMGTQYLNFSSVEWSQSCQFYSSLESIPLEVFCEGRKRSVQKCRACFCSSQGRM